MTKILTDYEDLVGKTIAFSHMAVFSEQVTLATTDGEILMASFDFSGDEERINIRILNPHSVIKVINSHEWMRKELSDVGAFDLDIYKKEQEELRLKQAEDMKIAKEIRERKQLADLKAKYEQ